MTPLCPRCHWHGHYYRGPKRYSLCAATCEESPDRSRCKDFKDERYHAAPDAPLNAAAIAIRAAPKGGPASRHMLPFYRAKTARAGSL